MVQTLPHDAPVGKQDVPAVRASAWSWRGSRLGA